MLLIQRGVNDYRVEQQSPYAHCNVEISDNGSFITEDFVRVQGLLEYTSFNFLVELSCQATPLELSQLCRIFGDRLMGINLPWPSAYYAHMAHLPIYDSLSEWEEMKLISSRFIMRPLLGPNFNRLQAIYKDVQPNHKVLLMCDDDDVSMEFASVNNIEGIITYNPNKLRGYFGP